MDLTRFAQRAGGNARTVVRKTMLDLGTAMVERTPVGDPLTWQQPAPAGYAGGRARGSWAYGYGNTAQADEVDASGAASLARIAGGVEAHDPLGVHYITSTLPYMRRLEYDGWSSQAPAGMVRVTIREFQEFVRRNAAEVNR
ncbi:hypothetical protein [Massilia sp. METH4]|uniref:hypothetical protein n=1 Tax=Massilia sp. METH4 TaxID=3123041 RepID=UPI0030CCFF21